ncbi:hypothetical protein BX281_1527 [Streptomyces sp. Ag82_O1-15]|uniref:hypothetical protein n=1 Tax=Streptomyces sp. Ag82_O1-15 TaxID=1938855 RepID=UPI000BB11B1A|nr:hypothetical protein [Streptomyces sp. Ag82_O1-15]PBC93689.1 hypothetical protein BX281_1527 [Streptomyces sp. Ag82_O1-15]
MDESFDELLEQGSLGAAGARRIRQRTSPETVRNVLRLVRDRERWQEDFASFGMALERSAELREALAKSRRADAEELIAALSTTEERVESGSLTCRHLYDLVVIIQKLIVEDRLRERHGVRRRAPHDQEEAPKS